MKRVLLRAPVLSSSGYGVHSRQILRWLKSKEEKGEISLVCQLLPWGCTDFFLDRNDKAGIIGYAMEKSDDLEPPYDVTFQLQLPNEWDSSLGKVNVGISAAVETTKCSVDWLTSCNSMDRIVVPSSHTYSCLVSSANERIKLTKPVDIIPESYIDELKIQSTEENRTKFNFSTPFNFLVHSQLTSMNAMTDRKNIFSIIKCFLEAFKDDENVGLILKTNICRNSLIDRKVTMNVMNEIVSKHRQGSFPKIHIIHGNLSDKENSDLYRDKTVKAFINLSHGEGFGLPVLEAAVAGVPVIATNWSSYLDFLDTGSFIPVEYSLVDIPPQKIDDKIFVKGSKWAQPSELDFKKKITQFRMSPEKHTRSAETMSKKLLESHSWESISMIYDKTLGGLL